MTTEIGLRHAKEIVEWMIATRCENDVRTGSWEEGWRLGMEEIRYRLTWELHRLACMANAGDAIDERQC